MKGNAVALTELIITATIETYTDESDLEEAPWMIMPHLAAVIRPAKQTI
jgi:hypothetical protein